MEVAPGLAFWPGFAIALGGLWHQHVRRRIARPARSAAPRLRGELRRLTFRHAVPVQTQSRLCIRRALERTCRVERVVTSSASPLAHLLPVAAQGVESFRLSLP